MKFPVKVLVILMVACSMISVASAEQTVTVHDFVRAETDRYLRAYAANGGFGKFIHRRKPTPIDDQSVIRMNRDTLYSVGVFDLSRSLTVIKPETGKRYQSMQIISQDHHTKAVFYEPGEYRIDREMVGTRYVVVLFRTLIDLSQPGDVDAVNRIQDAISVRQDAIGELDLPQWDDASLRRIRDAVNVLGASVSTNRGMFGDVEAVDAIDHLIGTAYGWGGIPRQDVVYVNVVPEQNDGTVPHTLTVGPVPVDGFWSVSLYDASGYFAVNDWDAYSIDDRSAISDANGNVTIHFGGDPAQDNFLKIMDGWNYVVRLYRPRAEILDGSWSFPEAAAVGRSPVN